VILPVGGQIGLFGVDPSHSLPTTYQFCTALAFHVSEYLYLAGCVCCPVTLIFTSFVPVLTSLRLFAVFARCPLPRPLCCGFTFSFHLVLRPHATHTTHYPLCFIYTSFFYHTTTQVRLFTSRLFSPRSILLPLHPVATVTVRTCILPTFLTAFLLPPFAFHTPFAAAAALTSCVYSFYAAFRILHLSVLLPPLHFSPIFVRWLGISRAVDRFRVRGCSFRSRHINHVRCSSFPPHFRCRCYVDLLPPSAAFCTTPSFLSFHRCFASAPAFSVFSVHFRFATYTCIAAHR